MVSRNSYKAHRMIFPSQEVFGLIKDFDKTLTPLFDDENYIKNILFVNSEDLIALRNNEKKYKRLPKDYCINENHYMKILIKLFYILIKLEDSAPKYQSKYQSFVFTYAIFFIQMPPRYR